MVFMKFWIVSLSLILFAVPPGVEAQARRGPVGHPGGAGVHAPMVQGHVRGVPGARIGVNPVRGIGVNPAFRNRGFRPNAPIHRTTAFIGAAYPYYAYPYYGLPYYQDSFPYPYTLPGVGPYVPEPYILQDYGSSTGVNSSAVSQSANPAIDALNNQVQQLYGQVQLLEQQLALASQPPPAPAAVPETQETPIVLVFRNGQRIETQGYAIVGPTLWIVSDQGTRKVDLSSLNVEATTTENLKRGVTFRLPSTP
jgi:hypothetical protein